MRKAAPAGVPGTGHGLGPTGETVQPGLVYPQSNVGPNMPQQAQHAGGQSQHSDAPVKKRGLRRIGVVLWMVGLLVAFYLMTLFHPLFAWIFASPLLLTSAIILKSQGFWSQKKNMFSWMNE